VFVVGRTCLVESKCNVEECVVCSWIGSKSALPIIRNHANRKSSNLEVSLAPMIQNHGHRKGTNLEVSLYGGVGEMDGEKVCLYVD
jgi:hypothetical protein